MIPAGRADEAEPSLVLAVAVRRSPAVVQSDEPTKKLMRAFVREILNAPAGGPEHRAALVVAGGQDHAKQLASLTALASRQSDASRFFELVRTPGRFSADVRQRLSHVAALVGLALTDLGVPDRGKRAVEQATWQLLSRLTVVMPRLEAPDEADWAALANALLPLARGNDLYGATRLRDKLLTLADEYAPAAADVDLSQLRRDAHEVVDHAVRRHRQGWQALDHLHAQALASVRDKIASADGARSITVNRSEAAAELLELTQSDVDAVVAYGDSGVGKSALAIAALSTAATADVDAMQGLCVNLRHLPLTTLELESFLGVPLQTLLGELAAPQRLLVIDGADAISEGRSAILWYLADSAAKAGVKVVAVAASDIKQLVRDVLSDVSDGAVTEYLVRPLTDPQVDMVLGMTAAGLQATGAWPKPANLAEGLQAFLDQQAEVLEREGDHERASKVRTIAKALVDVGTDMAAKVAVGMGRAALGLP